MDGSECCRGEGRGGEGRECASLVVPQPRGPHVALHATMYIYIP